jgi:hypothetical protein
MDDESAASLATEHLIALGHTRIGFIAGPEDYELSAWRIDGWRKTMLAAALADDLLARGDFGYASGRDAAIALLDAADPATAIIASNDQMALATLETCRSRGSRCRATCRWSASTTRRSCASRIPAHGDRSADRRSGGAGCRTHHRRACGARRAKPADHRSRDARTAPIDRPASPERC